MRISTLIGLCFLGISSLTSLGCASEDAATIRNVSGAVPTSDAITSVIAVQSGGAAKTYTAPVDASGHFSLALPIGQRFTVGFLSGSKAVGVLRYKSGATGVYSSLVAVGHAPTGSPADKKAQDASAEVEDEDIALGDVDNAAGDASYEPSNNPQEQVDSDDDGEDDYADDDDDGDGEDDIADDDGGGEDGDDSVDTDTDGLPDVIDTDDDGDGAEDASGS